MHIIWMFKLSMAQRGHFEARRHYCELVTVVFIRNNSNQNDFRK